MGEKNSLHVNYIKEKLLYPEVETKAKYSTAFIP